MVEAGTALLKHIGVMKRAGEVLTNPQLSELMRTFKIHVGKLEEAGVKCVSKRHLWAHLVILARANGNPRFHTWFLDASVNGTVATIARASHAANWGRHIVSRLRLAPIVDPKSYFA
eukprot:654900-Pyramimonas_sp.AAC.1